jgi:ABC-type nitrate/sulfonate/bicarbonate transport system substrate-binding protein
LLSKQVNSLEEIQKVSDAQKQNFTQLLGKLGEVSQEEAESVLNQREKPDPDNGLNRETIAGFQALIDRKTNERNHKSDRVEKIP